ncbi:hypothetical protein CEXT_120461 [Caerostris extrusa]|uniref:Uncharacterized protein n=1 Tax=Caerostris extrusa TaxID=172846 RepID=A0AAV4VTU6_CAEEX|nr:hypothetical protein CEXT_120461 [Caerostris extrusa]
MSSGRMDTLPSLKLSLPLCGKVGKSFRVLNPPRKHTWQQPSPTARSNYPCMTAIPIFASRGGNKEKTNRLQPYYRTIT